jgi:hypothetical protein
MMEREKIEKLVASKRKWAEHIAHVCTAESNQFRAGDIIAFCDELAQLLSELDAPAAVEATRCPACGSCVPASICSQSECTCAHCGHARIEHVGFSGPCDSIRWIGGHPEYRCMCRKFIKAKEDKRASHPPAGQPEKEGE